MASPPAKRRRRSQAAFLDEEDEEPEIIRQGAVSLRTATSTGARGGEVNAPHKPTKSTVSRSKSKPSIAAAKVPPRKATLRTESLSPNKPKKSPRTKKPEERSRTLHTFFGRASEEQRWNRKADTLTEALEDVENGDAIEDENDSFDESLSQLVACEENVKRQLDRRKDQATRTKNGPQTIRSSVSTSTHKFVKPLVRSINRNIVKSDSSDVSDKSVQRPWADRYGPANLEELAVHRKKVADVQKWLGEVLSGRDPRKILVLKGPAGSGKTTSVSLLSKALNFQTLHWSNPTVSDASMVASVATHFDDFINRSGYFGSLDFDGSNLSPPDVIPNDQSELIPRVLVVEEFPTNMTRSSSALEAFRGALLRYLAMSAPASTPLFRNGNSSFDKRPPIVLIISETLLTSASASADSFTVHRLLGPEVINHPLVTVVEFNIVAPTFVAKALDLVIKKEARDSQRRRIPGPTILKKLAEMGDIRSAINALEFLCARSADSKDWSGTVAARTKKSSIAGGSLTPMERNSLELVTQREATLGMFHAVGKVVYNKREDPPTADPTTELNPKPPDHLGHMHKSKSPQISIDNLMNETGTDILTFVSTLHENYVLSCNGPSFLESFDGCVSALSDSDILSPESRSVSKGGYGRGRGGNGLSNAGGIDMLRQNEINFHVAVRGVLFALPHPVTRATYPGGRKGDAFKMFYPASLRIWKPMEETGSLISTLLQQEVFASLPGAGYGKDLGSGVASWRQKNSSFDAISEGDGMSNAPRILASRGDMLFDRLPYLSKSEIPNELDMRKIKQITQFCGTILPDDEGDEGSEAGGMEPAIDLSAADETTDRAMGSPLKRDRIMRIGPDRGSGNSTASNKSLNNDVTLAKLYISDDDIEDD